MRNSNSVRGEAGEYLPKVLASAAQGVVEMIDNHNGDVDSIFGRADLNTNDLTNPLNELDLKRYCALFEEAAQQTHNDNFGLRFGDQFKPEQLGALGYASISSPTLHKAIQNLVGYFPAHQSNTIMSLSRDQDIVWLHYKIIDPRIPTRRQDAELSLGIFCNFFRHCLGAEWSPLEVHFEHMAPDASAEHESVFGAPVLFNQKANSIAFREESLNAVMPECDPYLFSVLEPILAEKKSQRENPGDIVEVLRQHIVTSLGNGNLSMNKVAKDMGMSPWQMQKRLKDFGVSFQELTRMAREELALRYVADKNMPLTEIALSLGYSELSAFSRAFRQWAGMSPQQYRRASNDYANNAAG